MILEICWKPTENKYWIGIEEIQVGGVDINPSGHIWYWIEDPNDRNEVKPYDYYWARLWSAKRDD